MELKKTTHPSRRRVLKIVLWILVSYVIGVFVRHSYGVRWEITNQSGVTLNDVSLSLVGWKYNQEIAVGELAPGQKKRIFHRPCAKSSYFLKFSDSQGIQHTEHSDSYITMVDSADVEINLLPSNKIDMPLARDHPISWESWLGFL